MNATQKFDVVDAWHRQLPNGTWIGMIERVHLGQDDVTGIKKACNFNKNNQLRFKIL